MRSALGNYPNSIVSMLFTQDISAGIRRFTQAEKASMVDAPEAWEYPKPGTEDEITAARAAESLDAPQTSTDTGATPASSEQ